MDTYSRRRMQPPQARFDLQYIIGDPFALSTISIALIGWIIALGGSIAVDIAGKFPTLTWWGIAFEFVVICAVVYVVGASAMYAYQIALVCYLAIATVYTTNSTNNFVWTGTPASGAVAAGHILMSIINLLWIFYFGTTDESRPRRYIDSFAIHDNVQRRPPHFQGDMYGPGGPGGVPSSRGDSMGRRSNPFMGRAGISSGGDDSIGMQYRNPGGFGSNNGNIPQQPKTEMGGGASSSNSHAMFTSDQLGAFENSNRTDQLDAQSNAGASANTEVLSVPTVYPYKATAMYSYNASPEDANEISFEKGEVLEIADVGGRWWQARRENGEVGICPSNYVQLHGQ